MRGRKLIDLMGERFGRLIVMELAEHRRDPNGRIRLVWACRCDCGKETLVYGYNLTCGGTQSCGCLRGRYRREG